MKTLVLVPVYRALTPGEQCALRNNCRMLAAHDTALLAPGGLDTGWAATLAPQAGVVRVSDEWLGRRNGIAGYNRMMLSGDFYRMFREWDYILICHTDAWIFRDELDSWTARGYDCVAAPWIRRAVYDLPLIRHYMALRHDYMRRHGRPCRADLYGRIGNGGLSLRRTASFIEACDRHAGTAGEYLSGGDHMHNEDVFWATVPDNFRYPTAEEALGFAFDTNPAYCYRLTGGRLPMGCHSWPKPRMWRFWRGIIDPGRPL